MSVSSGIGPRRVGPGRAGGGRPQSLAGPARLATAGRCKHQGAGRRTTSAQAPAQTIRADHKPDRRLDSAVAPAAYGLSRRAA